jgi:hypothetical protein
MAGKPSPLSDYHPDRINQPVQAEAPARGETGASRVPLGGNLGSVASEPRDGEGEPSLPI